MFLFWVHMRLDSLTRVEGEFQPASVLQMQSAAILIKTEEILGCLGVVRFPSLLTYCWS